MRLFPEIAWVNSFRLADPGLAVERPPVLLAPMAAILGDRVGRMAISSQTMRGMLDSIATRLDEARDIVALHDRPAGVPRPARHLLGPDRDRRLGRQGHPGPEGRRRRRRDVRRAQGGPRRAARRHGHFVLVVAVRPRRLAGARLPRPADRARRRTASTPSSRTGSRPPCATSAAEPVGGRRGAPAKLRAAIDRLREADRRRPASRKAATTAMANLAEAIQGLVQHMRTEQQMIRDWVDAPGRAASRDPAPAGDRSCARTSTE